MQYLRRDTERGKPSMYPQSTRSLDSYQEFLSTKRLLVPDAGFDVQQTHLSPILFGWQSDITTWALRRGRAALFTECGTGKSFMQCSWAHEVCRQTGGNVLILAPLAVAQQTRSEGAKLGITVTVCESQADVQPGINITNYEKLHHFDPRAFVGIVLDESSILKSYSGATRNAIVEAFSQTPYRLACTATPAPNDFMELGNHAEFLGIMSRVEMLSMFFVHDGGDTSKWRLKGHAEAEFWKWLASWSVMLRKPSDLGYSDDGFILPPLHMHHETVESSHATPGALFPMEAQSLMERRQARRASLHERVERCVDLANASDEPWLIWADLNDEADELESLIDDALQVAGRHDNTTKAQRMLDFAAGTFRVMVSKASIAGHGMNWQHCPNVAFVGLSDSWEMYYQAIRRCWRFGQTRPVHCYIITSEAERTVLANIQRKEQDAQRMADEMVKHMHSINAANIRSTAREETKYHPNQPMILPTWLRSEVYA